MNFLKKLISAQTTKRSNLCVGLDSRYDRIPDIFKKNSSVSHAIFTFNKNIIESTHDIAAVYKMNVAFYAGFGSEGLEGLRLTNAFLRSHYPDTLTLADSKRSEMGESVNMVKQEIFNWLEFDCVMVTPWFGFDTVKDYLDNPAHGVCVYVHDSNPSASEFQDLELKDGRRLYEAVAEQIVNKWNINGNVFVEAGATYPKQLRNVRTIVGEDMVILTSGVGVQGGKLDDTVGVFGKDRKRFLVNSSRGIIFAGEGKKDYFAAVRESAIAYRDQLQILSLKTLH